jgi:hypothetical protein
MKECPKCKTVNKDEDSHCGLCRMRLPKVQDRKFVFQAPPPINPVRVVYRDNNR